jgi:hypothetical protein
VNKKNELLARFWRIESRIGALFIIVILLVLSTLGLWAKVLGWWK